MSMIAAPTNPPRSPRPERGDATRAKLLSASIDVFGRYGFDGTTTRALADAAGVNLQAIPYYFGGKEGLYIAAAEHIASSIAAHLSDLRERLGRRLQMAERGETTIPPDEARVLLSEILQSMATLFASRESEAWARFLIREQMEPTEAFKRVYGGALKPILDIIGEMVAIVLGEDPSSEHVRLRALSLVGGLMVFRVARAAALAHLGWQTFDAREVELVRSLAGELATATAFQDRKR